MSTDTETKRSKAKVDTKLSDEQHHRIEVAAYYIAENSGFSSCDIENWRAAETEIDRMLAEDKLEHN